MRIDHHAYQQATRVAGVGFLLQAGMALTLLVFGLVAGDTPFVVASLPMLLGLLPWGGLAALFYQQKLERLEALEEDELASGRSDLESVFERADDEIRPAGRRLRRMHQLLMPILSIVIALLMTGIAVWILLHLRGMNVPGIRAFDGPEFKFTETRGWAVAICLSTAGLAFIFSRFVAGMAKQPAWQNLRGGAASMVGVALIAIAVATGIIFRFFDNQLVLWIVTNAIPWYMILLAAEIVLNFVLNVYRPRVPGETPRPAFDSKLLSLIAAPDNIVRTINDAVNYQFGFDITSSWGYQLLLRSGTWLIVAAVVVVSLLNTMVIVAPGEQGVRLAHGARVSDEPAGSGVMFKLPWPFQSAERYDVKRVRQFHLTGAQVIPPDVQLYTRELGRWFDRPLDPFMVRKSSGAGVDGSDAVDRTTPLTQDTISLVDAEVIVQYRIKDDGGLLDLLDFVPNDRSRSRLDDLTDRERALRGLALREVSQHLATRTLDEVLAVDRRALGSDLRDRIQRSWDQASAGIEVVSVTLPLLRPHDDAAGMWEEYSVAKQRRIQQEARGRSQVRQGYAQLLGDEANAEAVLAAIERFTELNGDRAFGPTHPDTIVARQSAIDAVLEAGGVAAQILRNAEADRVVSVMEARAQAARIRGGSLPYNAAPALFMERELMNMYARTLPGMDKYVVGVPAERLQIDFEMKQLDPLTAISDAIGDGERFSEGDQP